MNKEFSTPIASWITATSAPPWLRTAAVILGGSALLALCAHLALPLWFTPVPLTVQPFAVLLLGLLLTPRMAATTLCAYLAEGALGLPVFAPTSASGLAHLLGPTGGYLMAYPMAAVLISFLCRNSRRRFSTALATALLGDLVILGCGALWLALFTHTPARTVLALSVFPFLPGDAIKIALAAALASGIQRLRPRGSSPRLTS